MERGNIVEGSAVVLSEEESAGGVVPLEALCVPSALSGVRGTNRAPRDASALSADNDLDAMKSWLAARAKNRNTYAFYRKEGERFLLWCIVEEGTALSSITLEQAARYLPWLEDLGRLDDADWAKKWRVPQSVWIGDRNEARGSPGWKPFSGPLFYSSRRQAMQVVRLFFNFLLKSGYVRHNPFDQVSPKIPFLPGEGAPKEFSDRSLSDGQWDDVLGYLGKMDDGLAEARLRVILMMGKGLGMRASEMLASRVGWITVRNAGRQAITVIEVIGKGDKVRRLPLQSEHLKIVNHYLELRGEAPVGRCPPETPLLANLGRGRHSEKDGAALSRSGLHRILKRFLDEVSLEAEKENPLDGAKLRAASAHWLRHTFAASALESMPVNVVQTALGHSSLATTSKYLLPSEAQMAEKMKNMKPI